MDALFIVSDANAWEWTHDWIYLPLTHALKLVNFRTRGRDVAISTTETDHPRHVQPRSNRYHFEQVNGTREPEGP